MTDSIQDDSEPKPIEGTEVDQPARSALNPGSMRPLDQAVVDALLDRIVASPRATRHRVDAPWTGNELAQVPYAVAKDIPGVVARGRSAQKSWGEKSVRDRAAIILRAHDLLLDRRDQVLDIVQWETGKVRLHAIDEFHSAVTALRYYGKQAATILSGRIHEPLIPGLGTASSGYCPVGVVGVVTAWNCPLSLAADDVVPALVAGNAVVLRPDTQGVLSTLYLTEVLREAGLPPGVLQVVTGSGPTVARAVVENVDYVAFTGATKTGRSVASTAAGRLIGCSLGLGAKNSAYVADDVDIRYTAEGVVRSCFTNAGQLSVATERVLVHERIAQHFVAEFVRQVKRMALTATTDLTGDIGSLSRRSQVDRVQAHLEDAVEHGARVLCGGKARPDIGPFYFEPTVLTQVDSQAKCFAEETFGPLVQVYTVADDEAAVDAINSTTGGLNASVWTRRNKRGRSIASRIQAGTVNVNEGFLSSWAAFGAPQGGFGDAGLGRRHGHEGLLRFCEVRSVAVQNLVHEGAGLSQLSSLPQKVRSSIGTGYVTVRRYLPG